MNTPTALESHATEGTLPKSSGLEPAKRAPKSHWWIWLLVFAAIGYGCYRLYLLENTKKEAAMAKKSQSRSGPRSVPVVAAAARQNDMPVYLRGLGSVTPYNTVTVKSRIDGQLISVNFREGQYVNKGDLLAEIDPRPYQVVLDQAKGILAKDQAALKDAQANLQRDQELFNAKIIARQQLDTQGALVGQSNGSIQGDEASISAAQLNLTYTHILAPISGRIGLRLVDAGNMVHASDANGMAVIAQIKPIAVLFSLPQDDLPKLLPKLAVGAKLRAEAYDRNETTQIAAGVLETIDNEIDQTTGTSRLKAVFPNSNNALFPNQFVNIKLLLDLKRNAVVIPAVAVQRGPTGTFVYVVKPDKTVAVRPVKLGITEGNDVSLDDGLSAGESVVVDGGDKLTEGMKVAARTATSSDAKRRTAE